jgi:hypothetical protein
LTTATVATPTYRRCADVILDAVDLVRGARHASATLPAKQADVVAARTWIGNGNIGVLSFNDYWGWLAWDAEHVRQAIFSPPRGA